MEKKKVKDIKFRAPYELEVEPYKEPDFSDVEEILNKQINLMKKNGVNIDNASVLLKSIVEEHIAKALNELENQRSVRKRTIDNYFNRRYSDKMEFEKQLYLIEKSLIEIEGDFKLTEELYKEHNLLKSDKIKDKHMTLGGKNDE